MPASGRLTAYCHQYAPAKMRVYQAVAAAMRKPFEGKIQNLWVLGRVPKTGKSVAVEGRKALREEPSCRGDPFEARI